MPNKFLKFLLIFGIVLAVLVIVWTAFSLIGRIDAGEVIPDSAVLRVSVSSPARFIDGIIAHESLDELSAVLPILENLKEDPILRNRFLRLVTRGKAEFVLLSQDADGRFVVALDMKFFSPLLRILPTISRFVTIPGMYYVQAGRNSRFEMRMNDMTLYVGPYRNILYITDSSYIFESRTSRLPHTGKADLALEFSNIKPSSYDAALLLSPEFIYGLFADQDAGFASFFDNINFNSTVEAGLSILPRKLEFRLAVPLSSLEPTLSQLLAQKPQTPNLAEYIPASAQYATILSAGTLNELYQTAVLFSGPELESALNQADATSRMLFGLTLNELLFSWSGKEFAAFGLEGRPHPVYAIQVSDERKRQEVFDKAFKSIVLNEDLRLNLDGMRIPRIEVPEFLQSLLRKWDIYLPAPYYTIYKDYFLVSESAETLLAGVRAMQRNDVLPRTNEWRSIAGGKTASSVVSLYYSLDLSVPFFLRKNTALSSFLAMYRQGLIRIGIDRGLVDFSFVLVPGSGSGVSLVNGYPLDIGGRPSNKVYGAGSSQGTNSRIFLASGNTVLSINLADNAVNELSGQGSQWIIPADGVGKKDEIFAWVVSDRGRITLVDGDLEAVSGFPLLTGLRLSAPPYAFEGRLYLCDEDGKVHIITEKGSQSAWPTTFDAPLRSPPSFLTVPARGRNNPGGSFAAVYPKSFFGEIYILDVNGRPLPNWPAPISRINAYVNYDDDSGAAYSATVYSATVYSAGVGIGFGSPLLFLHNNKLHVAFVCQTGELIVYDENAVPVSPFPLYLSGVFYVQPVFDGEYMWLVSENGTLFRVSPEGELLYQNIPGFTVKEEGYITTFDYDGDKIPEIFITGEGNALYAFTRNFRSLEGFPLPAWGTPYFAEAQGALRSSQYSGNKKAEIFAMGMDRRLYRWQFK